MVEDLCMVQTTMNKMKVILITGTSRGIGQTLLRALRKNPDLTVYASSRGPDAADAMHLVLDITNPESCEKAIQELIRREGRIDVLINNAGSYLTGASEETTLSEIDAQMQLNFYGAVRMIKAVTPHFLRQKSGHIVNMSSLGGLIALPFTSAYNASKFALEGYTEALRLELLPFGIHVSNLEPAYVNTGTVDQSILPPANRHPLFAPHRELMHRKMLRDSEEGIPMERICRALLKVIQSEQPRFRYRIGGMSKFLSALKWLLPERIFQSMVLRSFRISSTIAY